MMADKRKRIGSLIVGYLQIMKIQVKESKQYGNLYFQMTI